MGQAGWPVSWIIGTSITTSSGPGSGRVFTTTKNSPHCAGSAAFLNDYPGEFTVLTRVGGGTLSPISIGLSELFDDRLGVPITFVGGLPDTRRCPRP